MFEWFGRVSFCPHTKVGGFTRHLREGRIMASRCKSCGQESYPPRADCPDCMGDEFEYFEISGEGTLLSFTRIEAAPAGFEKLAPFVIGVVELKEVGRLLACFGESVSEEEIRIGMSLQVVPRILDEVEEIRVYYSLEEAGSSWQKTNMY
ncbi:MAG: Zn-ribbon domain-containing OB-fold protein [Candidatus Krumholzibacteria bacterium]|jgi:hypothetical protein|nr:Zn-ribbon domain-containing OB-fold protein [Candidatus Krumholzibacteria bacterium]MDP6668436.1 Zn-ribbon domain-containing OB-fold protein [Candidatus Krumholzibacteria bacterium]MDP6797257.1 Zn-ribbon domain-containing OB-fold protein [Candidatus Krumholzibacteria bacterium]MDP7021840.1 Zn-ribbon domain-containing OB-fold protein [Candidatus Krumholzibacteria bacterium]